MIELHEPNIGKKRRKIREERSIETQFRHELKYYLNEQQRMMLYQRLSLTMDRDENGEYEVRSLYFDDILDSAVNMKMAGYAQRKKYRIRIYDGNDRQIKLECKEKVNTYIHKRSLLIDRDTCDQLIQGDARRLLRYDSALAHEVYRRMQTERLRPVIIVDYSRKAFLAPFQNVRITFDTDLRAGLFPEGFFDKDLPLVPVFFEGESILEVKFDEHLPEYCRYLLRDTRALRSAASKYVICRQFA